MFALGGVNPSAFVIRRSRFYNFYESHTSLLPLLPFSSPSFYSVAGEKGAGLKLLTAGGRVMGGPCSADLTVILALTGNIHHSGASNVKHILPQLDQSQAVWTTKCPVMPYFDHIIGE